MKKWYTYLSISLGLHAILISAFLLFSSKPAKIKHKPSANPIKSYLVFQTEPVPQQAPLPNEVPLPDKPIEEEVVQRLETELKESSAIRQPLEEKNRDDVFVDLKQENEKQNHNLQEKEPRPTALSINKAVKDYLNAGNKPSSSWQTHQRQQFQQRYQATRPGAAIDLTGETPFAHEGTAIDHIATSVDGAQLIKHQGTCYSVAPDQWGDNLWTPTPCPISADKNSKLLQQSLQKYGLLKNKQFKQ